MERSGGEAVSSGSEGWQKRSRGLLRLAEIVECGEVQKVESEVGDVGGSKGWTDAGPGSSLVSPRLKTILRTVAGLED